MQKDDLIKIQTNNLIDTDIIIDSWRGQEAAADFISSLHLPRISILTYYELINGAKRKQDIDKVINGMKNLSMVEFEIDAQYLGLEIFMKYKLSDGIGIYDSMIAATAIFYELTLITRNTKHYNKIPNLDILEPY